MKNSILIPAKEQKEIAENIIETEVKPQVEHYEQAQRQKSSKRKTKLSIEQKAYIACNIQTS